MVDGVKCWWNIKEEVEWKVTARLSNMKFMTDISKCYSVERVKGRKWRQEIQTTFSQGLAVMEREKKTMSPLREHREKGNDFVSVWRRMFLISLKIWICWGAGHNKKKCSWERVDEKQSTERTEGETFSALTRGKITMAADAGRFLCLTVGCGGTSYNVPYFFQEVGGETNKRQRREHQRFKQTEEDETHFRGIRWPKKFSKNGSI